MIYVATFIASLFCGIFVSAYTAYILKQKQNIGKSVIIVTLNLLMWFMLLYLKAFSAVFLLFALTTTALLGLSVVDLAIFEIPVQFNWFILVLGIIMTALDYHNWYVHLIGMFLVSGIFYIIALITKGNGMGGGDIKLMATVGLLLGWQKILLVMALGSIMGAVIHSIIMAVSKKEHVLAFGPYLSGASFIIMCTGDHILQWYVSHFLTWQ